jgi:hypothetical protein
MPELRCIPTQFCLPPNLCLVSYLSAMILLFLDLQGALCSWHCLSSPAACAHFAASGHVFSIAACAQCAASEHVCSIEACAAPCKDLSVQQHTVLSRRVRTVCSTAPSATPGAEFLDGIQTKALWVFLLVIHGHLYSFAIDFYFFKFTQPLTVSVKEKGWKPDRKPYPLPYGLRNPYRNLKSENSQHYAQKSQ